jgi:hypothetical protein
MPEEPQNCGFGCEKWGFCGENQREKGLNFASID